MKDEIQKLACDIIDKTGLEISEVSRKLSYTYGTNLLVHGVLH